MVGSPFIADEAGTPLYHYVVLLLILAFAGAVRFHALGSRSLWTDEFLSIFASSGHTGAPGSTEGFVDPSADRVDLHDAGSWWSIWTTQAQDVHPPVYFILLRAWRIVFGDGPTALRSLAASCSVLSIFVLFFVVREAFDSSAALWACAMLAVATTHVAYAREVRQYALQGLWGTLAIYVLLRIQFRGPSLTRLIGLGLLLWLMAETHYFFIGAAAAMGIYTLLCMKGPTRWRTLVAMGVAGLLFCITAGPYLGTQMRESAAMTAWLKIHESRHAVRTLRRVLNVPYNVLAVRPRSLLKWVPLTGLAALLIPIWFFKKMPKLILFWLWVVLLAGSVAISDLLGSTHQLDMTRYNVLMGPALVTLIAVVAAQWRLARHMVPVLIVLVSLGSLPSVYRSVGYNAYANSHRDMAIYLQANVKPGDAVVFAGYMNQVKLAVYRYYVPNHENPIGLCDGQISPGFQQQLRTFHRVWLIAPPSVDTRHYLDAATTELVHPFGQFCAVRLVNLTGTTATATAPAP